MKTNIVIGLGFGDEGKGLTTDFLCRQQERNLVIRFSGGHQAGHTVITPAGQRHVFSSIGSGALHGADTYWSGFCTFYPIAFRNEYFALEQEHGLSPKIYVDALAPVTTPFDVYYNQLTEKSNAHGSCGVGFGATMQRQESPCKLFVQDLQYPFVWEKKLAAIRDYYERRTGHELRLPELEGRLAHWRQAVSESLQIITVVQEQTFLTDVTKAAYDQLIFEGSQGILLDMDHGFFPHVTRCHTVSKNALALIAAHNLPAPAIYYITRAYQTRHGNGYLSNEGLPLTIEVNPLETNQYNQWQGHQRRSVLDVDLLEYALQTDANYAGKAGKRLVITCLDQFTGAIPYTRKEQLYHTTEPQQIGDILGFAREQIWLSYSDCGAQLRSGAAVAEETLIYP